MKKYYEEHPEERERLSEKNKQYWESEGAIKQHSELLKKYHEEHPEAGKEHSKRMKKYFEDNREAGKKHGERMKKYYEDNPDARQKVSEKQKNRSPEWIKKKNDTQGKNKPFDVYTKDGTFLKTFTYPFEATEYLQKEHQITSRPTIGSVLSGRAKSSLGFVFKYKEI